MFALVALGAWAFASPIGAGPDDDYHLVSIWCADGGTDQCTPGSSERTRTVSVSFRDVACYAQVAQQSAACQYAVWANWDGETVEIKRGNFVGEYPPVYYATMHLFAGGDIQTSALVMRLANAVLFVGLATALAALLPTARRPTLLWGWLVTLVPLGMFLIPSNNPSGWAITGVGTAFLALLGWFETQGHRQGALGALYLIGILMAAGARGDAAVYAAGATLGAALIAFPATRTWWRALWLPAIGLVLVIVLFSMAGQTGVVNTGFGGGALSGTLPTQGEDGLLRGFPLAAYNLLMLPLLWTGGWGTWGLGWLDTPMPAIVPWAAVSAFVVVGFAGLGRLNWRKAIAVAGVLLALIVIPVYVLTTSGDEIGTNLQPRYLLPLIVLFAFILLTAPAAKWLWFTRVQTFTILAALALSNLVALQVNIRRYVTGVGRQGLNLDDGSQWWWAEFPLGPTALWVIGTIAYAGLLAVLWPQLRRPQAAARR